MIFFNFFIQIVFDIQWYIRFMTPPIKKLFDIMYFSVVVINVSSYIIKDYYSV